jgi:hypothetical protein
LELVSTGRTVDIVVEAEVENGSRGGHDGFAESVFRDRFMKMGDHGAIAEKVRTDAVPGHSALGGAGLAGDDAGEVGIGE